MVTSSERPPSYLVLALASVKGSPVSHFRFWLVSVYASPPKPRFSVRNAEKLRRWLSAITIPSLSVSSLPKVLPARMLVLPVRVRLASRSASEYMAARSSTFNAMAALPVLSFCSGNSPDSLKLSESNEPCFQTMPGAGKAAVTVPPNSSREPEPEMA